MELDQYIHERDLYYVVNELFMGSLSATESIEYDLGQHRDIHSPSFINQRKILKYLDETKRIEIVTSNDRKNNPTLFFKAVKYSYIKPNNGKLRHLHGQLMLKLDEMNMNNIAITRKGTLQLAFDGEDLFVITYALKLKVNEAPMKSTLTPALFINHLVNRANGKLVTRESLPYETSRKFDQMISKAGIKDHVRKLFVDELSSNEVRLHPRVSVSERDIVLVTRQLLPINDNMHGYEEYMKGIGGTEPENDNVVPGNQ